MIKIEQTVQTEQLTLRNESRERGDRNQREREGQEKRGERKRERPKE